MEKAVIKEWPNTARPSRRAFYADIKKIGEDWQRISANSPSGPSINTTLPPKRMPPLHQSLDALEIMNEGLVNMLSW
jgi:hypothetical protein